jgi:glycosyltransferase involved in cell wall biosynthesis
MPYASIIIPTFNRSATLPLAVASAQAQTVADIEIAIAGDGMTGECAETAQSLAGADARIVVHDRPKAPGRGYLNRHLPVMAARSERIFYLDDDDLMLPNHVEVLGTALDRADVVGSCAASVAFNGGIHCSLVNHGAEPFRSALEAQCYKGIYDTHLAHSRAAYVRAGEPWGMPDGTGVATLLSCLARERSLSWLSLPMVTALSFHGGARGRMSGAERRAELEPWAAELSHSSSRQFFESGHFDWYLYQCLLNIPPMADGTLAAYLGRLGVTIDGREQGDDGSAVDYPVQPHQRVELDQVFALARGETVHEQGLGALVLRLIYPVRNKSSAGKLIRSLRASLGDERALRLARNLEPKDALESELRDFLEASLLLAQKRPEAAQSLLRDCLSRPLLYPAQVHLLSSRVERSLGNLGLADEHEREAQRLNPKFGRVRAAVSAAAASDEKTKVPNGGSTPA